MEVIPVYLSFCQETRVKLNPSLGGCCWPQLSDAWKEESGREAVFALRPEVIMITILSCLNNHFHDYHSQVGQGLSQKEAGLGGGGPVWPQRVQQ